jgi:hypothetical protein
MRLSKQVAHVSRDDLNDARVLGRTGGEARSLTDGPLSPISVPAVQFGEGADVGDSVVEDLALHGVAGRRSIWLSTGRVVRSCGGLAVARSELHRGSCPKIGAGGHGREMARVEDVGAGARCASAARGDVRGNGGGGGQDCGDDLPHRGVEPARRVDLQNDKAGLRSCASARPRLMYSAVAGPIAPLTSSTIATCRALPGSCATALPAQNVSAVSARI